MKPTIFGGDSFVTMLSPTGLRQSSPAICRKYKPTSHIGLTRWPCDSKYFAAGTISKNERLRKKRPIVNLAGLDGSRRPIVSQIHAKIGEKMITNNGSTDWNQLDGYVKWKTVRRVARSAKSVRLDPACSKPAQKISANSVRIDAAVIRPHSSRVNDFCGSAAADSTADVCGVFSSDAAIRYFLP